MLLSVRNGAVSRTPPPLPDEILNCSRFVDAFLKQVPLLQDSPRSLQLRLGVVAPEFTSFDQSHGLSSGNEHETRPDLPFHI